MFDNVIRGTAVNGPLISLFFFARRTEYYYDYYFNNNKSILSNQKLWRRWRMLRARSFFVSASRCH